MQTFLPLPSYLDSLRTLDRSRLGNQVWREGLTLIRGKWPNHPASKMWQGHMYHLGLYILDGCNVLEERGKDYPHIREEVVEIIKSLEDTGPPDWFGREDFHASHRSNLLRKFPAHYRQFWPDDPDNLPYIWPVS